MSVLLFARPDGFVYHKIEIVWRTSDGEVFDTKIAAYQHQARCDLAAAIDRDGIAPPELEEWIVDNAMELFELLLPLVQCSRPCGDLKEPS